MQLAAYKHCQRLGASFDKIKHLSPAVYKEVLFLLALIFAVDAENSELRSRVQHLGDATNGTSDGIEREETHESHNESRTRSRPVRLRGSLSRSRAKGPGDREGNRA